MRLRVSVRHYFLLSYILPFLGPALMYSPHHPPPFHKSRLTVSINDLLIHIRMTGASLQHYNPLIDPKVSAEWNIPLEWKLVAQMPFGKPTAPAGPKPLGMKKPVEERLKVYGA